MQKPHGICFWCKHRAILTKDHVNPRAIGGPDVPENIVMACERCNGERGHLVAEFLHTSRARQNFRDMKSKVLKSLRRRNPRMIALQRKWVKLEHEKVGYSPSEKFNLSLSEISWGIGREKKRRNHQQEEVSYTISTTEVDEIVGEHIHRCHELGLEVEEWFTTIHSVLADREIPHADYQAILEGLRDQMKKEFERKICQAWENYKTPIDISVECDTIVESLEEDQEMLGRRVYFTEVTARELEKFVADAYGFHDYTFERSQGGVDTTFEVVAEDVPTVTWEEAANHYFVGQNQLLLNRMCFDGLIEPGQYVVYGEARQS